MTYNLIPRKKNVIYKCMAKISKFIPSVSSSLPTTPLTPFFVLAMTQENNLFVLTERPSTHLF